MKTHNENNKVLKSSTLTLLTFVALVLNIGCSSGSSGSSAPAAAAAVVPITIANNPATVGPGGTVIIQPSGGTAPYTYVLVSSVGGTLSATNGLSTLYSAPAIISVATSVIVSVTDSSAPPQTASFQIYLTTTSTTTTGTITGTGTVGTCEGVYTMTFDNVTGTLTLVEDDNGNIAGNINVGGGVAAVQGSCSGSTIQFTNQYSGSVFSGTFFYNSTNTTQVVMSGTFGNDINGDYPTPEPWTAISQ